MKRKIFLVVAFHFFIFSFSFTSAQSWLWSSNGIGNGSVTSISSDVYGNCYFFGGFSHDTIHFGSYTVSDPDPAQSGLADLFLVKLDYKGNILWAKQTFNLDTSESAFINSLGNVYTDRTGNVYIASDIPDSLIIDADTVINLKGDASYVVKFDPNGNIKWIEHSTCNNNNGFVGNEFTTCDIKGNVFLSGIFSDTINFGAYALIPTTIWGNTYLVKYDSNGNVKWAKQSAGHTNNGHISYCNANDRFGNSFITGDFGDTLIFGSYQLVSDNNLDFYLTKYDPNGNVLWAKQSNALSGSAVGFSLVTDQTGNIYAVGDLQGSIIFDTDTLISNKGSFFLVKYDSNGTVLWAKKANILDNNDWSAWSLSIDNSKHLYLSANGGYGQCKIAFGGDTLSMYDTAKYDGASIILKLDSNGKPLCGTITPVSTTGGAPNAIASDTSGKYVYFGGVAGTIAIFGEDTVNPFSFPVDAIWQQNFFPFASRWEACDSSILTVVNQNKNLTEKVILYPNPNNGTFVIALQNVNESAQVEIYNVLGEEIYGTKLNSGNTEINLNGKTTGIYFYRVLKETGELIGNGKLIISK